MTSNREVIVFAVKGIVQGNTVVLDEEMSRYQGREAIVTVLDLPAGHSPGKDRVPGIAKGKFVCPDDIDEGNELIADWFEGQE